MRVFVVSAFHREVSVIARSERGKNCCTPPLATGVSVREKSNCMLSADETRAPRVSASERLLSVRGSSVGVDETVEWCEVEVSRVRLGE